MNLFGFNATEKLSDEELIARYKKGENKKLVGTLYKRYAHLTYGLCLKYLGNTQDAEDATMQVFERLFSDLLKNDVQQFKTWLYSYTKNHCLMQLRKRKSQMGKENAIINHYRVELSDEAHLSDKKTLEMSLDKLEVVLEELPEDQAICLKLFYMEQLSYQDISQRTGYELKSVKSHLQNGKRRLRKMMEKP